MSNKLSLFIIAIVVITTTPWFIQSGLAQKSISVLSTNPDAEIIKCLTPSLIQAQISGGFESDRILQSFKNFNNSTITNTEFHISPSGRFILNYSLTGTDRVPNEDLNQNQIPDYIEKAAEFADESYQHLVNELGYTDPLIAGTPYEIRFRQINSYGFTQSSGATSFIVIHRNFENFPENNDPDGDALGALKVTIAHELKHAIQYAATRWRGDSGRVNWVEMDATMTEEIVYPQVDDYINYLDVCGSSACSVIRDPNRSTPGSYYHATWMLYYDLAIGSDFWVDVWDELSENPSGLTMFTVIKSQLEQRDRDFNLEFTKNHLWHSASGLNSIPEYGFPDAELFPDAVFGPLSILADSVQNMPDQSIGRAAQYLRVDRVSNFFGELILNINYNLGAVGVGILTYNDNGSVTEMLETGAPTSSTNQLRISTGTQAQHIEKMSVVIANPENFNQDYTISLSARELPEEVTIFPNYPNPFNHMTTIPFSIPEQRHVRLDVFDVQGRLVNNLINTTLNKGFYDISFNGSSLASGLYFYILQTESVSYSGKIMLIK